MTGVAPRVIVIDDSAASISMYQRSSKGLDVDLTTFEAPEDALSFLGDNSADLVFLDILMRDRDGIALLKDIRRLALHGDTAVVIVTSKDYFQDRARAKDLGALDYLVKPLRSQEIREIICQHTDAKASPD